MKVYNLRELVIACIRIYENSVERVSKREGTNIYRLKAAAFDKMVDSLKFLVDDEREV